MNIVVSDTNIFIDLMNIELLDSFFQLEQEIHTVDFVIGEITNTQQLEELEKHRENYNLTIASTSSTDLISVLAMRTSAKNNVSITDCAACFYAKKKMYKLLTGDKKLRKIAEEAHVDVSGILFILDELVKKIVTAAKARIALTHLQKTSARVPNTEVEKRMDIWQ